MRFIKYFKNFASKMLIIGEFFKFLWARKLWWLMPIIIILFLFSLLIALTELTPLGPFIYTLF